MTNTSLLQYSTIHYPLTNAYASTILHRFAWLILSALMVLDVVVHIIPCDEGAVLELVRAGFKARRCCGSRARWKLFFFEHLPSAHGRNSPDCRLACSPNRAFCRRAGRRCGLRVSALSLQFITSRADHTRSPFKIEPDKFPTVISIDIMGFLWLMMLVVVLMSFWQIAQVRQAPRFLAVGLSYGLSHLAC